MIEMTASGGLMALELFSTPAAASPVSSCAAVSSSRTFSSHSKNPSVKQRLTSSMAAGTGPASAPANGPRRISSGWQGQHVLQPCDSPLSPRRSELAATPASLLPGRRCGVGSGGVATVVTPLPLQVLLPGNYADGGGRGHDVCGISYDDLDAPLPSMVPDGELLTRTPSSTNVRGARKTAGGPQGSVETLSSVPQQQQQKALASPGELLVLAHGDDSSGIESATVPDASGVLLSSPSGAQSRAPLLPSTPSNLHSRSLRAASVLTAPGLPTPLSPPRPGAEADGVPMAPAPAGLTGTDSLRVRVPSYKTQMQRLRVAVLALEDGEGGLDSDDDLESVADVAPMGDRGSPAGGPGTRTSQPLTLMLREQRSSALTVSSGGGAVVDDMAAPRRSGTKAWLALAESAPGCLGSSAVGGSRGSGPPSIFAKLSSPAPSISANGTGVVGFSRRPEEMPAAPAPANSRSLAAGGGSNGGSRPGRLSSTSGAVAVGSSAHGGPRLSVAWQPGANSSSTSFESAFGSASIGYSRRPEDLPAAPSPANSRSLTSGRSGGSTPMSPGAGGRGLGGDGSGGPALFGALVSQESRRQGLVATTFDSRRNRTSTANSSVGSWTPSDTPGASSQPIAAALLTSQLHGTAPPPPSSPGLRLASSAQAPSICSLASGEARAAAATHPPPMGTSGVVPSAVGWLGPAGGGPGSPVASGAAPKPPPLQHCPSIGYSRRPEDLPAAPSPANSRSLAGGRSGSTGYSASGSAGSNQSWCDPRASLSPATSETAVRSPHSRRVEPTVPSPNQSRSLRPDSSRAVFWGQAGGAPSPAGPSAAGLRTSQAPPSPIGWRQATTGGGGGVGGGLLPLSLGSPAPLLVASYSSTAAVGVGMGQQPQPRPSGRPDDVTDMKVVSAGMLEDVLD